MGNLGFTVDDSVEVDEFDNSPMPAGKYIARLDKAEMTQSKAGHPMIKIMWRLERNETQNNRCLFEQFSLNPTVNPGKQKSAKDITMQNLAKIRAAFGIGPISDTSQLVGKTALLSVGKRFDDYRQEEVNTIKGYAPDPQGANAPLPVDIGDIDEDADWG